MHSDRILNDRAFLLADPTYCKDQTITAASGTITDGSGDDNYANRRGQPNKPPCRPAAQLACRAAAQLPCPTLFHPLTSSDCREACTFVVDAIAGCGAEQFCTIYINVTGHTQAYADTLRIWNVSDRGMGNGDQFTYHYGIISASYSIISTTGMFRVTFSSDDSETHEGWTLTWRAVPGIHPREYTLTYYVLWTQLTYLLGRYP
jgi:hypothetical protein